MADAGDYFIGKTIRVPGILSVRTRFLHGYFIPLVPRSSSVFLTEEARDALGITAERIELHRVHWRSASLAWLRFGLLLVLFVSLLVLSVQMLLDASGEKLARFGAVPVAALVGLYLSYRLDCATADQLEGLLRDGSDVPFELVRYAAQRLDD